LPQWYSQPSHSLPTSPIRRLTQLPPQQWQARAAECIDKKLNI
jgi:hypothetical protein